MSDVSESLRWLTKNEQMSESLFFWANEGFAHFFAKNEQFARKTDERIPNTAFGWSEKIVPTNRDVSLFLAGIWLVRQNCANH